MRSIVRGVLVPYSVALAVPCLIAAGRLVLEPVTGDESAFLLFMLAVIVTAWLGGWGPSLVATLVSGLLSDYFFLSPGTVVVGNSAADSARLALFAVEGAIIGWIVASFLKSRDSLREASSRKDDFIAILAHELRNCLGPLQIAGEVVKQRAKSDPILSRARDSLDRQIAHIARLVDDLLESSRALKGKVTLQKEVIDLRSVCQQAADSSEPLFQESGQELTLSLPPEPLHVEADPIRLMQILMNLLANSSKYSHQGGRVRLVAERRKQEAVIRIRDDGQGISPEMLPHIFEPFTQCKGPTQARRGLGVGLALVRSLVKLHGGTITAHSQGPGEGSEFEVRIPRLSHDAEGNGTRSPQKEHTPSVT